VKKKEESPQGKKHIFSQFYIIFSKPHGSMTGTYKYSNHPMQMNECGISGNKGQSKTVHKEQVGAPTVPSAVI
jgi:hypothetical protein